MRILFLVSFAALSVTPAAANDDPLSAAAFEAFVTGKTLAYSTKEGPFGAEDYLENRRVRWSYLDGQCMDGVWYPVGEQICFQYDEIEAPQCWTFFLRGGRLLARFENREDAAPVYQTDELSAPLQCLGPRIGA